MENLNQSQNLPPTSPLGTIPPAPQVPTPPTPQPTNPITPPIQPPPLPQASDSSKGSNKAVLFGGLGVIALAIIGGIYFLAVQYSQKTAQVPEITPIPRVSASPTPPLVEATEKDINKIDLGNPENELKGIEQDLKEL